MASFENIWFLFIAFKTPLCGGGTGNRHPSLGWWWFSLFSFSLTPSCLLEGQRACGAKGHPKWGLSMSPCLAAPVLWQDSAEAVASGSLNDMCHPSWVTGLDRDHLRPVVYFHKRPSSFLFSCLVSKYLAILSSKELPHVQVSRRLFSGLFLSDLRPESVGVAWAVSGRVGRQKVTEGDQSDVRACYFLHVSSVISYVDSAV